MNEAGIGVGDARQPRCIRHSTREEDVADKEPLKYILKIPFMFTSPECTGRDTERIMRNSH